LLLFDEVFSELFGRNFNPTILGIQVGLKLFFIWSLESFSSFAHWRWW